MPCEGNGTNHCCYMAGKPCPYLEKNVAGRRWSCRLRRELGDWDSVLASDRYIRDVAPVFEPAGMNCKTYPDLSKGQRCFQCGKGFDV